MVGKCQRRALARYSARAFLLPTCLALAVEASAVDAIWTELPPLPIKISNNAVASVVHGNGTTTLYSFMGILEPAGNSNITAMSFKLTLPGGTWQRIADAPLLNGLPKIAANAIAVAGEVYLIGGYSVQSFRETTEHRLFRYDEAGDVYVELARVPVEVDDAVVGVYQDRYIYLVSGWHGPINNNVPDVQVYDTGTDTWTAATPIPAPLPGLFGHSGTVIGDRIIYCDGVTTVGGFLLTDRVFVGRIDPQQTGNFNSIAWTEVAAHPGSATYRAAASQGAALGGRMLLLGGTDNPYNFNGIGYNGRSSFPLDQVLSYDPIGDDWRALTTTGPHEATMDHRGLVRAANGWVTVGGMLGPRTMTDRVFLLRLVGGGLVLGDLNCDGALNGADIDPFFLALGDPAGYGTAFPECTSALADMNCDGRVDGADIDAFFECLGGGNCP